MKNDKLMTLEEVAEKLRISKDYANHQWPSWSPIVRPARYGGKGALRFWESEINALIESWRVMA